MWHLRLPDLNSLPWALNLGPACFLGPNHGPLFGLVKCYGVYNIQEPILEARASDVKLNFSSSARKIRSSLLKTHHHNCTSLYRLNVEMQLRENQNFCSMFVLEKLQLFSAACLVSKLTFRKERSIKQRGCRVFPISCILNQALHVAQPPK